VSEGDTKRIYELIDTERKERITSIDSIHERLDDIFALINKQDRRQPNGSIKQTLIILGFMVTAIVAVVTPIRQQMEYVKEELDKHALIEAHPDMLEKYAYTIERFKEVETQFDALREVSEKNDERQQARFNKLEDWQRWWYRNIPERDGVQRENIKHLNEKLNEIKKVLERLKDRLRVQHASQL